MITSFFLHIRTDLCFSIYLTKQSSKCILAFMGRHREFDMNQVLTAAQAAFIRYGYQGCSIDNLVDATGLLRGSLYSTFGSKYGLFKQTLQASLNRGDRDPLTVDLILVALMEIAPSDANIRSELENWFGLILSTEEEQPSTQDKICLLLGSQLLKHAHITPPTASKKKEREYEVE